MKTLLLEIGTEEIPARFLIPAKEGLNKLLEEGLNQARITFTGMTIQATPRRLAAVVSGIAEKQAETTTVKFGPPFNRAYDDAGKPTKAAEGFAKSQGVAVEDLKKGVKDGVEFITVEKFEKGEEAKSILAALLPDIIAKIPFQKKMHWGAGTFEYARPIQWICCLFGSEVVSFSLADVTSSNVTWGHRFLSDGKVTVTDPAAYYTTLKENFIVLDEEERLATIREGVTKLEGETKGRAIGDEGLIREILYITEYPYPLLGGFDREYLGIPKEVLVNVMKSHQRYIPIEDASGGLMPWFIFFANTVPKEDKNVIRGNEKVLRARLADARFFFEEDKKKKLIDGFERLGSIVFHVKLGTLRDKCQRVMAIADYLAGMVDPSATDTVEQAARLMKTDLVTHMVGEFPELQGTMGRIYTLIEGEDKNVAAAIEEHYLPTGGNGALPQTPAGAICSIADKLDSIVAFFSAGITPTGNLDPYALRRQSLGIIKIVIDRRWRVSLPSLIERAYDAGAGIKGKLSLDETRANILDFISTRFKYAMLEEEHNQDYVEAVLPCVAEDIYDGYERLVALETQKSKEDFDRLMVGFRRVYNIAKQVENEPAVDSCLFALPEEKDLYSLYESKQAEFFRFMNDGRYTDALSVLVGFKESIDNYFDKVFVMDKDEAVKNNRLAALARIKAMFLTFADFSKIRIE